MNTSVLYDETEDAEDWTNVAADVLSTKLGGDVVPHVEYRADPVGWARDKLGIPENTLRWSRNPGYEFHKWDGTPDPLASALEALARGQCVVMESGTGTGKTFTLAVGQFWFQACWQNALVRSHAPKQDQLTDHMWKEIADMWPRFQRHFRKAKLDFLRIRMDGTDKWGARGVVAGVRAEENESGSATKAQGAHAEHMLSIVEETPGMPPPIMTAIRQTSVSPHNLIWAVGNPDHQFDELHKLVGLPRFVHIRVSALDHPNVVCNNPDIIPGAVSALRIDEAKIDPGEGTLMYDSRVRGISPAQSADAIIKLEWLEEAAKRYEARDKSAVELLVGAKGVDVAKSRNGDKAAVATFRGEYLTNLRAFQCSSTTGLGRDVVAECRLEGIAIQNVGVDTVGLGAGTQEAIAEVDPSVVSLAGGPIKGAQRGDKDNEWTPDSNRFLSLRCQMWWQLAEDLRKGKVHMPRHAALWRQLTSVKYEVDRQKVIVESKQDIRKRTGGASPDEADAVVYANWVRPREKRIEQVITPVDHTRDIGAQESEYAQQYGESLQYANPDEEGAFSQFTW